MNARMRGEPRLQMVASTVVALILSTLPLPLPFDSFRPPFLVLIVVYWSIATPRAGGLSLGFFSGLALDIFTGSVLGQHALALSVITYVAVREHQKVRSKPFFQQSLMVLGALILYEAVLFSIDGWSGHPITSPMRWMHVLSGAIVWPLLAALLERTHDPR
jgi:rod shape-determining protein MreD